METVRKGALCWERYRRIPVAHGFTTRPGGLSTGVLSSLNLGIHRGDDPETVLENYRILGQAMGFDPRHLVLSKQIHSDIVYTATEKDTGAGLYREELPPCDALITCTPGVGLAVFSADCVPILLWDPETGAVGAAHAGWRGTAARIAGKTAEKMAAQFGCKPRNIRAAIGPHIGPCCFQTDGDVPEAMEKAYGRRAQEAAARKDGKYYVDLTLLNRFALLDAGVTEIGASALCTACNPELFWSHRKTGNHRGSQAGIILCEGVKK